MSAAAAAGLFIGVGFGGVYYSHLPAAAHETIASIAAPSEAPGAGAVVSPVPVVASEVNEQFLSELELALERPHTRELVVLDEITPHVREVRVQLR
jgi:hypothetical protein